MKSHLKLNYLYIHTKSDPGIEKTNEQKLIDPNKTCGL